MTRWVHVFVELLAIFCPFSQPMTGSNGQEVRRTPATVFGERLDAMFLHWKICGCIEFPPGLQSSRPMNGTVFTVSAFVRLNRREWPVNAVFMTFTSSSLLAVVTCVRLPLEVEHINTRSPTL